MAGTFFLKGAAIGFAIAAVVGPISVLCFRRALAEGPLAGLVSGLGAATADALYGAVAGFGLAFIATFLVEQRIGLGLAGGLFLCYLGVKTLLAKPAEEGAAANPGSLAAGYVTTFFLTLTNPMTILSFVAVFAGLGLGTAAGDYLAASWLVLGVFLGSALWWAVLAGGAAWLKARSGAGLLRAVNRASGLVIFGFGAWALWRVAAG
ncbi:MAG: LysE family transporter [Betaproteobacteria bacterium]|nr:LysE family transporter [Betaproteobacteria bacterium]